MRLARMLIISQNLVPHGSYVSARGQLRLETAHYAEVVEDALKRAVFFDVKVPGPTATDVVNSVKEFRAYTEGL